MNWRRWAAISGMLAVVGGAVVWSSKFPQGIDIEEFSSHYETPLTPPLGALKVYHLGHSLVGRDMPAMLDQLAQAGGFDDHGYASQLGWGASLRQHWEPDEEVPGYAVENDHPAFRPAQEAIASGEYDAVVLTEMVEIKDAVKYHDSADYLAFWTKSARSNNPDARVYLYETWHRLDDPAGWLARIDTDLARHWEGDLLRVAKANPQTGTIYMIPGGQVLAAVTRAMEMGEIPGLMQREELFARDASGAVDPIHLNDLGAYLIALTHYAVLYHRSPEGLPHMMIRADGSAAEAVPDAAAPVLQRLVWDVVTGYAPTGVGPRK